MTWRPALKLLLMHRNISCGLHCHPVEGPQSTIFLIKYQCVQLIEDIIIRSFQQWYFIKHFTTTTVIFPCVAFLGDVPSGRVSDFNNKNENQRITSLKSSKPPIKTDIFQSTLNLPCSQCSYILTTCTARQYNLKWCIIFHLLIMFCVKKVQKKVCFSPQYITK